MFAGIVITKNVTGKSVPVQNLNKTDFCYSAVNNARNKIAGKIVQAVFCQLFFRTLKCLDIKYWINQLYFVFSSLASSQ